MLNVAGEKCVKNAKYLYYLSIGIKKNKVSSAQ